MRFTRNEQLESELLSAIDKSMDDSDRHQPSVSGMIYCLTKTYYENELIIPGVGNVKHTDEQVLLFITGLKLEKVILEDRQISEAGETEGIQWHVDHYGSDGFIEVKSTRSSSKYPPEEMSEGWKKQFLAYFYAKGIIEGDIAILHLMGNYAPPFPQFRVYHINATQNEVNENWAWIKERSYKYAEYVALGEPPTPFKYNMEWECKNCNWKGLCDAKRTLSGREL